MHLQSIIQCLASTWLHHLRLTTVKRERGGGGRERAKENETERQTDRQMDRDRDRHRERQRQREREKAAPAEKLYHSNVGHFADAGSHKVEVAPMDVEEVDPILHLQHKQLFLKYQAVSKEVLVRTGIRASWQERDGDNLLLH